MTTNHDVLALQARVSELEAKLSDATGVVSILYHALDDASSVVDRGDDEDYAYQAELEAGASYLGIDRDSAGRDSFKLEVEVLVAGNASDEDDEQLPGVYGFDVTLSRAVELASLTPGEAGSIAQAVLDEFHNRQGIECLDDFTITARIKNGPGIAELDDSDQHEDGLVDDVEHLGKVGDIKQ